MTPHTVSVALRRKEEGSEDVCGSTPEAAENHHGQISSEENIMTGNHPTKIVANGRRQGVHSTQTKAEATGYRDDLIVLPGKGLLELWSQATFNACPHENASRIQRPKGLQTCQHRTAACTKIPMLPCSLSFCNEGHDSKGSIRPASYI